MLKILGVVAGVVALYVVCLAVVAAAFAFTAWLVLQILSAVFGVHVLGQ